MSDRYGLNEGQMSLLWPYFAKSHSVSRVDGRRVPRRFAMAGNPIRSMLKGTPLCKRRASSVFRVIFSAARLGIAVAMSREVLCCRMTGMPQRVLPQLTGALVTDVSPFIDTCATTPHVSVALCDLYLTRS